MRSVSSLLVLGVLLLALGVVLASSPGVLGGGVSTSVRPVTSVVREPVVVTVGGGGGGGAGRLSYHVYSSGYIMSAVYKVYGNPELGFWVAKTVVENTGSGPLYDVKVSYKIEGYTDWSEPEVYPEVMPGGAVVSLYYPILPASLARLQTSSPSRLYVRIEYRASPQGRVLVEKTSRPLQVLGIHDFVFSGLSAEESTGSFYDLFSNYPLLAAWVTPKDPAVEYFADAAARLAGGAGAALGDEDAVRFLAAAWQLSVANGISYLTEPQAFWTGRQAQWVKYPRDVLRDRSGTCIDTAIFYASLAMSQGLKAYIVLMPGHAFPLVELPSGQLVPIETTLLNEKADFKEAVETGLQMAQRAFSGPYLVVDVAALQAEGVVPPELPPIDVSKLNLVLPGQHTATATTTVRTVTETQSTTVTATETVTATATSTSTSRPGGGLYVYRGPGPHWSVEVPQEFGISEALQSDPMEVDFSPSNGDPALFAVLWSKQYSLDDLRSAAEAYFEQQFGKPTKTHGPKQYSLDGVPATAYGYENDKGALVVVLVKKGGYNYAIIGVVSSSYKDYVYYLNAMYDSFKWR